jgi:propionyl-CoA carboxylase alpha chain
VEVQLNGAVVVRLGDTSYAFESDWTFGRIRIAGRCNGRPFTAQVERHGLWLRVVHGGARIDAIVLSPRGAELLRLMPYKPPPDTSKFLLAPMPGLLAEVSVQPGQAVLAGERLAVVEAMKMENILTATQDATVAEVLAAPGESLAVDQPILRFE